MLGHAYAAKVPARFPQTVCLSYAVGDNKYHNGNSEQSNQAGCILVPSKNDQNQVYDASAPFNNNASSNNN